ncbi:MAG TPA: site-specific integrase [Chloroflexota bacterium]|nr:site-specific integrase [Chloroflexota bacterium]
MAIRAEHPDEKKPKRQNGEGSVFFWPGRGWYAAVTGGDGRRIMRKAPKQTERGAEMLLRELLAQRRAGELTRGRTTLAEFKDEWLRSCKRRNCRPGTLDTYDKKLSTYVLPTLGKTRLDKLTAGAIEKLYDQLGETGLSAKTLQLVHVCLGNLLKLAKRRRLVGHVVTELVDPPRPGKYEARPLTVAEAKLLLRSLADHRYGPFWTVMLGLGCRFGEAAGLRWPDVDLETGTVRIRQAVNRRKVDGKLRIVIDDVKTEAGRRDTPLPHWAITALAVQRDRVRLAREIAGDRWVEHGLVFPNRDGGPLHEAHVNDAWHEHLRTIGLEGEGKRPIRMHDLRHSKGTLMADEGEDVVVIQRTLGHAKSSITADLYIGRVPKALKRAADRYGDLLDPGAQDAPERPAEAV